MSSCSISWRIIRELGANIRGKGRDIEDKGNLGVKRKMCQLSQALCLVSEIIQGFCDCWESISKSTGREILYLEKITWKHIRIQQKSKVPHVTIHMPIPGENHNEWVMLEDRRPGTKKKSNCLMIIVSQAWCELSDKRWAPKAETIWNSRRVGCLDQGWKIS